jgi:hypothetical protein
MKKQQEDYGKELQAAYDRWAHIYEHGASDPTWEDGVNLNLVRNHIFYYRGKIEENVSPEGYPAAYFKEIPPEVEQKYMARPDEIRAAARASLAKYMADPNYQYLLRHRDSFTPRTRDKLSIDNVIGYAAGLKASIENDNLVDMRRHERYEGYLQAFGECVHRIQAAPPEIVQHSLFSLLDGSQVGHDGDDSDEGVNENDGIEKDRRRENAIRQTKIPIARETYGKRLVDGTPSTAERFANIPDELKSLNQWAVYRTYPDKESGKLKKVIISPVTASFARSDMPETWTGYEQAKAYAERYRYQGLVFALDKGVTFIDLDRAIDKESGEMTSPEARRLLELLPDTYTERSVSGTGIHILMKASLPADAYRRNDSKGIEMYDTLRFVCMTGDVMNGSGKIHDYSDRLGQIAYTFAGRRRPRTEYAAVPVTQSDTALIEQILKSRSSAKFQALYRGDASGYPSWSHAESALVFMLAWWTQNPAQIDVLSARRD